MVEERSILRWQTRLLPPCVTTTPSANATKTFGSTQGSAMDVSLKCWICTQDATRSVYGLGFCTKHFGHSYGFVCDACKFTWNGWDGFCLIDGGLKDRLDYDGILWNGTLFHASHFGCSFSGSPLWNLSYVAEVREPRYSGAACQSCASRFPPSSVRRMPVHRVSSLLLPPWTKKTHYLFPKEFREAVRCVLLVGLRLRSLRDVLQLVIVHLGRMIWQELQPPKLIAYIKE